MSIFGFFRKLKQQPARGRYQDKPFLKLVDSFVLKSIGALDGQTEATLQRLTPTFRETFKQAGTWEDIVITQLHFAPDIRVSIRELWMRNQVIAIQQGVTLTPMRFCEMFVAENVSDE